MRDNKSLLHTYKKKSVWEKSPFLANFRLLLKRKILLNQGLLIPRFSRIS